MAHKKPKGKSVAFTTVNVNYEDGMVTSNRRGSTDPLDQSFCESLPYLAHIPIPDHDTVSRYCSPRTVQDGQLLSSAFVPRETETYLSVNWLEFLSADLPTAFDNVRAAFQAKEYHVRPNGRFAVRNVGAAKHVVFEAAATHLRVLHWPEDKDPSHSGIFDFPENAQAAALELAVLARQNEVYPAIPQG